MVNREVDGKDMFKAFGKKAQRINRIIYRGILMEVPCMDVQYCIQKTWYIKWKSVSGAWYLTKVY